MMQSFNTSNTIMPVEKAEKILSMLDAEYPEKRILLNFSNSFELLIGVILSARTTDRQVNEVTQELFSEFPDSAALSRARLERVEDIIRSTGFYRQKAKNIIAASQKLAEDFAGAVPDSMDKLLTLPGVGRKSANVVLGNIFGKPAVIVDTHFSRVVKRLGLTGESSPEKVEKALAAVLRPEIQTRFSTIINYFGRDVCFARKPACEKCVVSNLCNYYSNGITG